MFEHLRLTENLPVLSGAAVTATASDSAYPVANVTELPVSLPWRSSGGTRRILIDLGSSKAVDTVVLVGSNLSAAATADVRSGSSADPSTKRADIEPGARGVSFALFAERSDRYWAIRLPDSGTTYAQVGYILLGKAGSFESPQWGATSRRIKTFRKVKNEFGLDLTGAKTYDGTEYRPAWYGLSVAEADEIEAFLDSLDLTTNPALLLPLGRNTMDPLFARLQETQERTNHEGGHQAIDGCVFLTDDLGRSIDA